MRSATSPGRSASISISPKLKARPDCARAPSDTCPSPNTATRPTGAAVTADLDGKRIPMLAPENTVDGGHLNAGASRRAALALVEALADAFAARSGDRTEPAIR